MEPPKETSFEQSLAELEEIAAQLEIGNTSLDESLALYEKGVAALKRCYAMLDKAEKRIRALVPDASGGAVLREIELPPAPRAAGATPAPEAGGTPTAGAANGVPSENACAPAEGGLGPGPQDSRKTKKRVSWPTVDTKAPARKNENQASQRPEKGAGSAGGSLFGGAQQ